jgi:hypothetical protein
LKAIFALAGFEKVKYWALLNFFSKINTEFLKKTISEMLVEKKERKFTEAVEL